jgi:hypothetical protein
MNVRFTITMENEQRKPTPTALKVVGYVSLAVASGLAGLGMGQSVGYDAGLKDAQAKESAIPRTDGPSRDYKRGFVDGAPTENEAWAGIVDQLMPKAAQAMKYEKELGQ